MNHASPMAGGMSHGPGVAVGTQGAPLRAAAAPILFRRMPFWNIECTRVGLRPQETRKGNQVGCERKPSDRPKSGPQREAVFSADVQRRARKQAQRRRCRAAWASRVQWRGAAGSDVHRVFRTVKGARARGRGSSRPGPGEDLVISDSVRPDPLCIRHTPPYRYKERDVVVCRYKYRGRYSSRNRVSTSL